MFDLKNCTMLYPISDEHEQEIRVRWLPFPSSNCQYLNLVRLAVFAMFADRAIGSILIELSRHTDLLCVVFGKIACVRKPVWV